jgi:hypothetical protein
MAKHGLTIQEVEGLKATGKNHMILVPNSSGLYLRVGPKNGKSGAPTKSWVFRYEKKLKGPVWVTIGRYPQWSIRRAVEQAGTLREALRSGQDPRLMIKPVVVEPDPTPAPPALKTVNQLLDLFNATMEGLRESTRTEYLRFLRIKVRVWVDPEGRVFGERPALDITGADAAALLAACRVDAPRTSTMVAIKVHQCWDCGMTLEVLPDRRNIWKGQIRPKIKKKDRHLTETELVKVGKRLASCGEPEDCIIGYKLFLLASMLSTLGYKGYAGEVLGHAGSP